MIRPLHPFPARMAPELAIDTLRELRGAAVVLDPMAGSGTVVRHACDMGHRAIGFDVDPLSVLIGRVWTRPIADEKVECIYKGVLRDALAINPMDTDLPWIDGDEETRSFVDYWFGKEQQRELRCISSGIYRRDMASQNEEERACVNVLKVALSRIIVTKEQCASLARDTSHSRPHRVARRSDYSVFGGFEKSVRQVRGRLCSEPPKRKGDVRLGDSRRLEIRDESVDMVITSPPYLNAIDYMRGHRLSLVWLGHKVSELRAIRAKSVGAERRPDGVRYDVEGIMRAMGCIERLPLRHRGVVERYAGDVLRIVKEIRRVLRPGGVVTFVIGNSRVRNVFINNTRAIEVAASLSGLQIRERFERELLMRNRYLPVTTVGTLGRRIRTETIVRCRR